MNKEDIEEIINVPNFATETELKEYLAAAYSKIHNYELSLYEKEEYTDTEAIMIKTWREKLLKSGKKVKHNITLLKKSQANQNNKKIDFKASDHTDLEETVKMLARQVTKAEDNTSKLIKSTVKLKGLNYTTKELQKEIEDARKRINIGKEKAKRETFLVYLGFVVFLFTCIFIILDKFGVFYFFRKRISNCFSTKEFL